MKSKSNEHAGKGRRQAAQLLKQALRDVSIQLSMLSHQVGVRISLRHVDLGCLDLIMRHGPISPSNLARDCGLHPATLTGVLDRLERDGWIERHRDAEDRRAVLIRALPQRGVEILAQYAGMNRSMDDLCAGYSQKELELITEFLRRTAEAGTMAGAEMMSRSEDG